MLCVRSSICFCVIPTLCPRVSLVARSLRIGRLELLRQLGVLLLRRRNLLLRRTKMVLQTVAPYQPPQRGQ